MSADRLLDELWGGSPPLGREGASGPYVAAAPARSTAEGAADPIATEPPGYVVRLAPEQLDLLRFERLVDEGRRALAAGDAAGARHVLHEALALWRGHALADLEFEPFAQHATAHLEELHIEAQEARIATELALGGHAELVPELQALVAAHPLRERLRGQLMLALYRAGRQADALDVYRDTGGCSPASWGSSRARSCGELEAAILRQEPALAPRVPGARTRLPRPASTLIGRTSELAELADLLRKPALRLLTLTGPGGSGKTRLALELGWKLIEEVRDGVVFVDLGPVTGAGLVAATVARELGLGGGAHTWEQLAEHLSGKEMLLVLDNFEHVLGAAPSVGELVHAVDGLRVVATSRAPLELSDEWEYVVHPLPVPRPERLPDLASLDDYDAAAFLLERARAAGSEVVVTSETVPALAEICIRLDGLPLALELAAPRLKMLSPDALLERLGRRLDIAGRARDLPDRQRTLRATIEWSHELLAREERELFPRLAVFRGGFTRGAVRAVTGRADPLRIDDSLQALVDWNLVVALPQAPGGPRLRMLETIREYGLERLSLGGAEEVTRERHARFFLRLAEQAEPDLRGARQAVQMRELGADNDNLREALTWFQAQGEVERGFRLVGALWRFWQIRGQLAEGREHAERLLAIDTGDADAAARARALACAGRLAFFQGDYPAARRLLGRSLALQQEVDDAAEAALLIVNFGMLAHAERRRDDARALLRQGAESFRAISDAWGEANALAYLALVEQDAGRLAGARDLFHRSLELANAAGELRMAAFSLTQLGAIAREAGRGRHGRAALRGGARGSARARGHVEHRVLVDQPRRPGAQARRPRPGASAARAEPRLCSGKPATAPGSLRAWSDSGRSRSNETMPSARCASSLQRPRCTPPSAPRPTPPSAPRTAAPSSGCGCVSTPRRSRSGGPRARR